MEDLICFMGCRGAGKDYQAKKLVEQGYVQINFADELRQFCWELIGWEPADDEEYDQFKKRYFSGIYLPDPEDKNTGMAELPYQVDVSGRELLQRIGASMRKRNKDFWVICWLDKVKQALKEGKKVVCSDMRHFNEYNAGMDLNAKVIFCDYHSDRYNCTDTHESEAVAQALLKIGLRDMDIVTLDHIKQISY